MVDVTSVEPTVEYMRWYITISHSYVIPLPKNIHVLRTLELETFDELVAEE